MQRNLGKMKRKIAPEEQTVCRKMGNIFSKLRRSDLIYHTEIFRDRSYGA